MRNALVVPFLLSLLVLPGRAGAQIAHDPAAADQLFEHGKSLLQAGDWAAACEKFRASMSLDPAVGTLLKIARCDEHDGKLALALHDYQEALALNRTKPDQTDARRAELDAFTHAALDRLEPRVPKLRIVIESPPPGLHVTRGGEELPAGALGETLPIDPGAIEVVATAPGYRAERRTLQVGEGAETAVTLQLVLGDDGAAPRPAAAEAAGAGSAHTSARRIAGYAVGGAGLAALGVAGAFGIVTVEKVNEASPYCVNHVCKQAGYDSIHDATQTQVAGFILLAVGSSLVGGGVVLLVTSPAKRPGSVSLTLTPSSFALRGSF